MKFTLGETGAFQTELDFGHLSISGNSEIGYRPFQLLVSSIAGCSGGVFRRILEKKRMAFDSIEILAEVERNEEEANRVTKIMLHFIVEGEGLQLESLHKSLALAMKNCAMAQSVKSAIEIVETVEIREN